MTNTPISPSGYELSYEEQLRFNKAKKASRRHSFLVAFLRVFLPVAGLSIAVGIIGFVLYTNFFSYIKIGEVSFTSDGLVMSNPHLTGNDGDRGYSVHAERAIQRISNPKIIDLETINADISLDRDQSVVVVANKGTYNSDRQTLELRDNVKISYSEGYSAFFDYLDIDMKTSRFVTQDAMELQSDGGYINAGAMDLDQKNSKVTFTKGVKLKLLPSSLEKKQ